MALASILLLAAAPALAQGLYELVDARAPMCRSLVKVLNQQPAGVPMNCRRTIEPVKAGFSIPDWKPLEANDALRAALALERSRAESGPPAEVEKRYAKLKNLVERTAREGVLKAWESTLDIAQNGERMRVVLVSSGECGTKLEFSSNDPITGVFAPNTFEVPKRYRNLAHAPGDILIHNSVPYLAVWTAHPGSTLDMRSPPPKLHKYYLLVQSIYWVNQLDTAGIHDTVCQIGYDRLRSANQGDSR